MAIRDFRESFSKAVDAASDKAKEFAGMAADGAKEGAKAASEKAQQVQYEMRKKYYNPLFPDEYFSEEFDRPKVVVIEDEDARKGIDVCEGAIGWLSKAAGSEVLHLYEEFVPDSGLVFYPRASCESIYYMNTGKDRRYINLSCYFETMHQDKLTELKNIAYCLGAKECRLESYEVQKEAKIKKKSAKVKVSERGGIPGDTTLTLDSETGHSRRSERRVVFSQKFEGSDNPVQPVLDWYEHDREILSLIDMRMNGRDINPMKEYSASIDSSLSLSMDVNLAAKLDKTMAKLGAVANFTLEGESLQEMRTKLEFVVIF